MSQQQQQQYHLPPGAMPPNIDPNAAAISAQHHNQMVQNFWQNTLHQMEHMEIDFKNHPLPLARIKKVMKSDGDVKMISSEAPLIFSKACEIFIAELTLRSWMVAEENKRRTLQRTDIAQAISKSDQYDFLIDIVPREELAYKKFKVTY
ncbi:histone-fold-containing protein [Paraphysoderma sedebokerense]|nr:histone-fold-containing protein [Paraphysoderma sedebokerense]